nr:MAG TPA: hypothetical protein [Caudoviricetes sp.]
MQRKTATFATLKRSYHFLTILSLQNRSLNVGVRLVAFIIFRLLFLWYRNVINHAPTCQRVL